VTDKKSDKSTWAIGGVLIGTGVGFFYCRPLFWRSQVQSLLVWPRPASCCTYLKQKVTEAHSECIKPVVANYADLNKRRAL
jgi:hypothetical protein